MEMKEAFEKVNFTKHLLLAVTLFGLNKEKVSYRPTVIFRHSVIVSSPNTLRVLQNKFIKYDPSSLQWITKSGVI
jgi:hypothetical protein